MSKNSKEKRVSLVLSIFKGENFVCKKPSGFKLQITAKVGQQTMQSGRIQLVSTDSEPQFNSQLAWSFSEREWRVIRSQGEVVKVECILLSEKSGVSSDLGYCVLYVKDAFLLTDMSEIDPSNAHTSPLFGLKDPWKLYGPKLQLLLHYEDSSLLQGPPKSPQKINNTRKNEESDKIKPNPIAHKEQEMKMPLVNSPSKDNAKDYPTFSFQVNSESGYFELGSTSEDDDLYTFNITIISGTNIHKLTLPRNASKIETSLWLVQYEAYGCVIKSDPFELNLKEENSRTFIGDKATARIRANSGVFWNYIKSTSLEFRLLRYDKNDETNKDIMGIGFVDLEDLSSPNIRQLKYTLELVSEVNNFANSKDQKPEIKVLIELDSVPNFFKSWERAEVSRENKSPLTGDNEVDNTPPRQNDVSVDLFATCDSEGEQNLDNKSSCRGDEGFTKKSEENPDEIENISAQISNIELDKVETKANLRPQANTVEPLNKESPKSNDPSPINSNGGKHYEEKVIVGNVKPLVRNVKLSPQVEVLSSGSSSESSSRSQHHVAESQSTDKSSPNYSNVQFSMNGSKVALVNPGSYKISIVLSALWLKTRNQRNDKLKLKYVHPPLGIESHIVCSADSDPSQMCPNKPDTRLFVVKDGTYELTVIIPSFSEDLLASPLNVVIERSHVSSDDFTPFAISLIPLGDIFLEKVKVRSNNTRLLTGDAPVIDKKNKRVGKLEYEIKLKPCEFPTMERYDKLKFTDRFRFDNEDAVDSKSRHLNKELHKNKESYTTLQESRNLEVWKLNQEKLIEKKFREKGNAYLAVLSAEFKKRESERNKFIEEKNLELTKRQKEIDKQAELLGDKERDLKEQELQVTTRQNLMDQETAQQEIERKMKRLQNELQNEIDSLQRQNNTLNAKLESSKGEKTILEKKLEEKEEKIRKLIESRAHSPNRELCEKVHRLEVENESLKKDLKKAEKERQEFKNTAKSLIQKLTAMQAERDMELKDENENLKLQLLASKEQKEMRKERKEIKGVSDQLRDYKEIVKTKSGENSDRSSQNQLRERNKNDDRFPVANCGGDSKVVTSDRDVLNREIVRLSRQRQSLIETGCYNNYDQVVKEMGERIVHLAQNLN